MSNDKGLNSLGLSINTKFRCFAMRTSVSNDLRDPFPVYSDLYAFSSRPIEKNDLWTRTLGTDHDDRLSSSNLFLVAFSDVTDNSALSVPVSMVLYSLLLQGRAYSVDGLTLGGHNSRDGLYPDATGDLDDFYQPPKMNPDPVDAVSLQRSAEITQGIARIFRSKDEDHYLRLRKGFGAFLDGIKEGQFADARLHHFVRAIEAAIKPSIGRTEDQFVHRAQRFGGRSDEARGLMRQLFKMRSAAEHLNSVKDILGESDVRERDNLVALRTFQAELLASHVYIRLFTDQTLLEEFRTDDQISAFWKRPDHELDALWGPTIELEHAAADKFCDEPCYL